MAMTWVFLIHLLEFFCAQAPKGSIDSRIITFVYPLGNLSGVFFVIISGCFLYRSLLSGPVKYLSFLRCRLARIYSVFSVVLTIYLLLSFVFPNASKLPHHPLDAAAYILQNLLLTPGVFPIVPIITVSWTLSYIVLYCLILPPVIELSGMRKWQARKRVLWFLAATVLCAAGAAWTHAYPERLALLPVGAIAWEALAWRKANPQKVRWAEAAAAAIAVLALGSKYWLVYRDGFSIFACSSGSKQLTASAVSLSCLSFALFSANSITRRLLSLMPLRWLGNISYSYYLTHGLLIKLLTLFTPAIALIVRSAAGFWAAVAVAYIVSLLPAAALFLLVEKPALRIATAPDRSEMGNWRGWSLFYLPNKTT